VFASIFTAVAAVASAQNVGFLSGQSASGPAVTGAPYSGDGTTTVKAVLYDGTRIERHVTARFYRDSAGRIRREQTLLGLEELNPSNDSEKVVMIVDPVAGVFYSLNPGSHEALRMPTNAAALADQPPPPPPPPAPVGGAINPWAPPPPPAPPRAREEALGTRQIEGMPAIGRRTVTTIPAGQVGNDRPLEISDERWESPDLKVVLVSRHHDPRTGDIEYRLTHISRAEPARDLFTVPSSYTIVDAPPPPPPPPPRRR
jgi:hypothetical protein